MANSFAGIEIGKRSLMAHSTQIQTAGHNISNADTEGYSRQRVIVKSFEPIYRPDLERAMVPGQIGQGCDVESIKRIKDELLESRIVEQKNVESYWETRDKYYSMIESVYNEPNDVSVRTNMDKFWQGWQELSTYPESDAARLAVVVRGQTLTNSIQQQYKSLRGIGDQINGDIEAVVKQVNDLSRQIASVNGEIVRSKGLGDNPNDLMDRRDLLVEKLSSLINVTVTQKDPDEFMVHTDGQIIVQGSLARQIETVGQLDNNGYGKLMWSDTKLDAEFHGGTLGALVELRDKDIRTEIQSLNTMALNFADLVNDVHRNAIGKNNTTGLDFFVQHDFVENVNGNYDRNGDGVEDTSYIFRMTGTNALKMQEQIGLSGTMTINGASGNIDVAYFSTDTVEDVINRINDSNGEVKAYLDRNSCLVLKATSSNGMENPDFVIRHVEDSGMFLTGYSGILQGSGADNAYDFNRANAVDVLAGAQFAVSPVLNPSAYIEVNGLIQNDVSSVAAAFKNFQGFAEPSDGRAAVEMAAIRNTKIMIGSQRTFDDYFADTITNVGLKGEQAQNQLATQNKIMGDLRDLRDSISGVNIDEELADIIKFQHGYNVAAKFISVQDELLDTLINRLGV
ncbi:MAG: flagellar hook-associated protein FlgK [Treponema succinifaciens]|uniref:flagellar hook-associated protein FlgK n=1 Tax=Treponema succinifaciens TaxID=167 RepID=UPI0023551C1A|nr:flagellar hook-associated protein FlgK [Treponema succinifaciens]MCI6912818.1 flagellar hook-associated protein FlgK [Treponema succinifaciens]MDY2615917.1 flagellar hook-associated protein FlgK [Treponema succinifaciens]